MDFLQALGTLLSFTAFGLVGAAVLKAFQIANDIGEIKEVLRDIRRDADGRFFDIPRPVAEARRQPEVDVRAMDENAYVAAIQAQAGLVPPPAAPAAHVAPAYQAPVSAPPAYQPPQALHAPVAPEVPAHSPENLVRAVNAESELPSLSFAPPAMDETPVLQPEVVHPRPPGA